MKYISGQWKFNSTLNFNKEIDSTFSFLTLEPTEDETKYKEISCSGLNWSRNVLKFKNIVEAVYSSTNGWANELYRTIILVDSKVTDEVFDFITNNAIKVYRDSDRVSFECGLSEALPKKRRDKTFYLTEDTGDLYLGQNKLIKESELAIVRNSVETNTTNIIAEITTRREAIEDLQGQIDVINNNETGILDQLAQAQGNIDGLESIVTGINEDIGTKADEEKPASGIYEYVDNKINDINEKIGEPTEGESEASSLYAKIQTVDNKIGILNGEETVVEKIQAAEDKIDTIGFKRIDENRNISAYQKVENITGINRYYIYKISLVNYIGQEDGTHQADGKPNYKETYEITASCYISRIESSLEDIIPTTLLDQAEKSLNTTFQEYFKDTAYNTYDDFKEKYTTVNDRVGFLLDKGYQLGTGVRFCCKIEKPLYKSFRTGTCHDNIFLSSYNDSEGERKNYSKSYRSFIYGENNYDFGGVNFITGTGNITQSNTCLINGYNNLLIPMIEGNEEEVGPYYAFVSGRSNLCSSNAYYSICAGSFNTVKGYSSVVLGSFNTCKHDNNQQAVLIGHHLKNISNNQVLLGYGTQENGINENDKFVICANSNAFHIRYRGSGQWKFDAILPLGAYETNYSDYAEYFEWEDLNKELEDRRGYLVTLVKNKIKKASSQDTCFGIISSAPGVIGNANETFWGEKYLKDKWGNTICENILIPAEYDENGEIIFEEHYESRPKINPEYDPSQEYIPRSKRPEWAVVGLLGQILTRDDGTCVPGGYAKSNDEGIATHSDEPTNLRVMERTADNIVRIFIK